MTKPTNPPTSNPALDPFRGAPFHPFPAGSQLDRTKRDFASINVQVQSVEEQSRAAALPGDIRAGNAAPRFGGRVTPPPFTPTTSVPVPAPRRAGGSESKS
jgi:hypothetical protein